MAEERLPHCFKTGEGISYNDVDRSVTCGTCRELVGGSVAGWPGGWMGGRVAGWQCNSCLYTMCMVPRAQGRPRPLKTRSQYECLWWLALAAAGSVDAPCSGAQPGQASRHARTVGGRVQGGPAEQAGALTLCGSAPGCLLQLMHRAALLAAGCWQPCCRLLVTLLLPALPSRWLMWGAAAGRH